MRKRPGRRLPAICLFSAVLLLAAVCFSVWRSYHSLTVTTYRFPTDKAEGPVRLAVMSDLHEHVFGQDNAPLVEAVAEQRPDLILLCGDMLNAYSASSQNSTELVGALSKIAPVYYAWGNHELDYLAAGTSPLEEELVSAGATVLDRAWRDLDIHGTPLRLGGLYDYAFALDDRNSCDPDRMDPEVCRFLTDFQDTERFTLMLSHRPDSFALGEAAYQASPFNRFQVKFLIPEIFLCHLKYLLHSCYPESCLLPLSDIFWIYIPVHRFPASLP